MGKHLINGLNLERAIMARMAVGFMIGCTVCLQLYTEA